MPTISGIQAISLFQRSSGIVVQKNRIVANQGEANLQNALAEEDALGRELFAADESVFEFACFDTAGNTQLETWAEADTEVELVTAGLQENVLWYEPATIKIIKPFSFATKNRNYTRIRISKSGGAHKIWRGVNLLDGAVKIQGFETGWQDSNSNGLADGWDESGAGPTVSFSSGIQTISAGGSNRGIEILFAFPISGISVKMSGNVTNQRINGSLYQLESENSSSVQQALSSVVYDTLELGVKSLTLSTPSGQFFFQLRIITDGSTGSNDDFSVNDLSIRTDGKSTYVAY